MNKGPTLCTVTGLLLSAALAMPTANVAAQDAKTLAGTYAAVSNRAFGDNPRGLMILGADGHYSLILARATLPKVAAGTRDKGTADENKAVVGGSIAHWGKFTVDTKDKSITFNIEGCTFANWDGTSFKRPYRVSGDQLTYTNTAPSAGGGAFEVVWKRVK